MKALYKFKIARHLVLFVLLAAMLFGCAEINHLREAQVTFNETARLENSYKLAISPKGQSEFNSDDSLTQANIRAGYASVILSLESLSAPQKQKLRDNKLLGSVYLLQAMSYQRLGKTKEVNDIFQEASKLKDDEIGPRDKALLSAMDGFTSNSQAFSTISYIKNEEAAGRTLTQAEKNAAYTKVKALLDLAQKKYQTVRDSNPEHYSLRVFLDEAILASLKNHQSALAVFDQGMATPITTEIKNTYSTMLEDLCRSKDYTEQQIKEKFNYWSNITGASPEEELICQ